MAADLEVYLMRASEFITERKKKRKKPRWAAYGPGPYGGYGYYAGYSGDSSGSGGDGGGGGESIKFEASYPGNIGMMELAKFFQIANPEQKQLFKQLLEKGKKGLAWKLIQDIVGVKLQGKEFGEDVVTELKITDKDVQQIIKDKLAIDADSGVEAMRLAIEKMSSLPSTPYVRSQSAQLMMLYKQAKMSIGGDYYRKLNQLAENFADGKNPGRKGLAKRSGVNTKASVSSLRKTAKNSSGEKQRMAHWLANMKAGRAKKNK